MSIGRQLLKNIFTSWAGFGLRVLIAFFFTPYITSVLGEARYGAWVIVFATIDYLSMADIGMKQSLVRFISQALGEKRMDKVNNVLNTANLIYLGLTLIVLSLALALVHNLEYIIEITDPALLSETKSAMLVLAIYLSSHFLLMPFANTLGAFHRFDISNSMEMISEIVRVAVLVALLSAGYGLVALVWAIFLIALTRQIVSIIVLRRLYPEVALSPKSVKRDVASKLLGYSKISFLITIMWLIIFRADAYILGGVIAVSAAGIYAPASQLFHYLRNLINAVGTPLVPAISHLETTDTAEKLAVIYLKGIKYIAFLTGMFTVGCLFYAKDFVRLWLAPEFAQAGDVMMVLALPTTLFLPQIIGNSILFGIEKHKKLMYVLMVEALLKITLGITLTQSYGLIGLAYATAIPQALLYGIVYPQVMKSTLGTPVLRIYLTQARSAILSAAVSLPVAFFMRSWLEPTGWIQFFVNVTAILVVCAVVGLFIIEPDDKERVRSLFGLSG